MNWARYLREVHQTYSRGDASEPSYIEGLAGRASSCSRRTVQPKRTEVGIPDFRVTGTGNRIIGYIEAKDPATEDLKEVAEMEQLKRYRDLPNLILTNFFEFWLFGDGKLIGKAKLANPFPMIELGQPPPLKESGRFAELLDQFLSFSTPQTYTAKALATELARRTRLLQSLISVELGQGSPEVAGLYEAFKEELIESLTPEGFADMYAQTITYGLFSARMRAGEQEFSRRAAYEFIPSTIPLLRRLFYFLTGPNLPESLEWIVDDITSVLANADISSILAEFHTKTWTDDPVIHFYETFLAVYNPRERERRGVYYTPPPVVSYIVRSLHHLLKEKFGKPDGLADRSVTLLDPAAGTLTFPTMAIKLAKQELEEKGKAGLFPALVRQHILKNFYAFELLVAPYAIGHLKAAIVLEDLDYHLGEGERFQLYLTNSLEMKEPKELPLMPDLAREGQRAKEIKERIPILVICGNPPYSVSSENKSEFIEGLMDDYKEDVRGERNIQPLSDDYIKFIRFAQWKIEQAGRGIVGYISNNSYLSGLIHRGMRQRLLEAFDVPMVGRTRTSSTSSKGWRLRCS